MSILVPHDYAPYEYILSRKSFLIPTKTYKTNQDIRSHLKMPESELKRRSKDSRTCENLHCQCS